MSDTDTTAIDTGPSNDFAERAVNELGTMPTEARPPRIGRQYSQQTRAAFSQAFGEQGKQRFDPAKDSADDEVPAIGAEVATQTQTTPAAAPQQASPSAEAQAWANLQSDREQKLAERERMLTEREGKYRDVLEQIRNDPASTVRDLIREAHGLDSDDRVREYTSDVVTDLTAHVLKLPVPDDVKLRVERQKVERTIKEHNRQLEKLKAERDAEESKYREQAEERAAAQVIHGKLEASKATYPWLMVEDNPAAIVMETAKALAKKDPSWVPSWEDAAKRANAFFQSQNEGYYAKRKHLFTPPQPKQAVTPFSQQVTQDRAPGSRPTTTLKNADAAEPPTGNAQSRAPQTNEQRRAASLRRLAGHITKTE